MRKDFTPSELNTYITIVNVRLRIACAMIIYAAFVTILIVMLCENDKWNKALLIIVESVLGGTMYQLTKHFFPTLNQTVDSKSKTVVIPYINQEKTETV